MRDRLFDKVIILILQMALVFIFSANVDDVIIYDILLSISILIITEMYRWNTIAVLAIVFSAILSFFTGAFNFIVPVSVYSLCTSIVFCDSYNNIIDYYHFYSKKIEKNYQREVKELTIRSVKPFTINMLIVMLVLFVIHENAISIVVTLLSIAMALKTDSRIHRFELLEKNYDKSRQQMYNIKKKNEETMQLSAENIYMATLEERNRIAREIHDNVGHMLTRAIVQMQALKVVDKDENARPLIDSVDETINQAMLNIRRSVHELHDDSIDISIMTNELLKTLPEQFDSKCKTSIESAMGAELKNTILSILKESITNIIKYSNGNEVTVEIIEHKTFWRVSVFDNGENAVKEYDSTFRDSDDEGGIGLINIYSRVKKLGGRTHISSNSEGFTILATIPKL